MEVVATAKWVRATPRKARLVAATVEGLSVGDALTILAFTPRAAAIEVAKVVKSAAANAEHNYNLDVSTLRVARIEIDGATVIKRFQPRAQGRAFSILKRTSHLRAVVTDDAVQQKQRQRRRKPAAAETEE
jgi:large subunit ribosomal protein L22